MITKGWYISIEAYIQYTYIARMDKDVVIMTYNIPETLITIKKI